MENLSRREKLHVWREKTGRTPMKRMSYLQPCENDVTPSIERMAKNRFAVQSCSVHRGRKRNKQDLENIATSNKKCCLRPQTTSKLTPGARHSVNRVQTAVETAVMKELFQRDIDDTIAEMLSHESSHSEGLSKELKFETSESEEKQASSDNTLDTASVFKKKQHRRRSSAYYVNSELAFESSKICYTTVASEHRRGRRSIHRYHVHTPESSDKCLVYVTPVRRSTRKSRSICPDLVAGKVVFNSPSEAQSRQDGCVRVLPNDALATL